MALLNYTGLLSPWGSRNLLAGLEGGLGRFFSLQFSHLGTAPNLIFHVIFNISHIFYVCVESVYELNLGMNRNFIIH